MKRAWALLALAIQAAELRWDYPFEIPANVAFEVSIKTNLSAPWQVWTNVVGTNRVAIPSNLPAAFFIITKVYMTDDTNDALYWAGAL